MREKGQCKNSVQHAQMRGSLPCNRKSTGEDGLCDVCRSAKARGRKVKEQNEKAAERTWAILAARQDRDESLRLAAERFMQYADEAKLANTVRNTMTKFEAAMANVPPQVKR